MASVAYGSLPFGEQIAFFRNKVNLPTKAWTDIWQSMHDHAFVVAGVNRTDMLKDFRAAVDAAIANGETLAEFRKRFDAIVKKYGWNYKGGRNWRSRVIYETNMRTSYAAGRYAQLQRLKKFRPYWRYKHLDSERYPRPLHESWDGLVLAADDPWWDAHFPPGGWGCKCYIEALNERDLRGLGKDGPDTAPPPDMREVTVGTRGPSPRTVETPAGIDPGFGYTPGRDVWMREQVSRALREADAADAETWEPLIDNGPKMYHRPARMPLAEPPTAPGAATPTVEAMRDAMHDALGGAQRVFDVKGLPVAVDADAFVDHIGAHLDRGPYLAWLPDLLENPYEVWWQLERGRRSGAYRVRARIVKGYRLGRGKMLLFVADQHDGVMTGWTYFHNSDQRYMNRQRRGLLWWGAPDGGD